MIARINCLGSLKLENDKNGFFFKFSRKDLGLLDNKQNKGKYEILYNSGKFVKFTDSKLKKLSQQYVELCQVIIWVILLVAAIRIYLFYRNMITNPKI
jgi:hypothetical protein